MSDYLQKMRDKLAEIKGRQDASKKKFLKIERDTNVKLRFLPYRKDENNFPVHFFERVQHYLGAGGVFGCARLMGDKPCAICQWAEEHSASVDEREIAVRRKFRPNFSYAANVLLVGNDGTIDKEPQILCVTTSVYTDIMKLFEMDGWVNVLCPFKGNTFMIKNESIGPGKMNVRYHVVVDPEQKGPIAPTKEEVVEIIKSAYDLEKVFMNWPPFEEQQEALQKALGDTNLRAEAMNDYIEFRKNRGKK